MPSTTTLRRFSDVLHELYRVQAPADVLGTFMAHLGALTPHDIAVPAVTDRRSGAVTLEAGPASYRAGYARHAGEDASRLAHLKPRHPAAVRLSDLVPRRALEQAPIWTEVMRPHRIRHVMTTCLHEDARVVGVLKIVRSGHGRDFSAADCEMLAAVAGHVRLAHRNAEALARLGVDATRFADTVDDMPVPALVVNGAGQVVHGNSLAAPALARCFGASYRRGPSGSAPLPSPLRALLDRRPGATAVVGDGGSAFVARATRIDVGTSQPYHLLVLEERRVAGSGNPLSAREREIMHWVAEGKTNAEIGAILGISPRTVQTHLEHCFEKLGVVNRAQAVAELARVER